MNVPSGRLQCFVLEASDYLERLAGIAARPAAPDSPMAIRRAPAAMSRLVRDIADDGQVSGETPETEIVPIESLAPNEPALPAARTDFETSFSTYHRPQTIAPASEEIETDVVPIGALLYRGRAALLRADDVRRELSGALKRNLPFYGIEPLVSELIDLVPLALED